MFPKSWNKMEIPKRLSKYNLFVNFFASKKNKTKQSKTKKKRTSFSEKLKILTF